MTVTYGAQQCSRCLAVSPAEANFCTRCGLELTRVQYRRPKRRGGMAWLIFPFLFFGFYKFHSVPAPFLRMQQEPVAIPYAPPLPQVVDPNFFQPVDGVHHHRTDNPDSYGWNGSRRQ